MGLNAKAQGRQGAKGWDRRNGGVGGAGGRIVALHRGCHGIHGRALKPTCRSRSKWKLQLPFESLSVLEGDAVPTVNGVTFSADIAIQGGTQFFVFGGAAWNDTGNSAPFNTSQNPPIPLAQHRPGIGCLSSRRPPWMAPGREFTTEATEGAEVSSSTWVAAHHRAGGLSPAVGNNHEDHEGAMKSMKGRDSTPSCPHGEQQTRGIPPLPRDSRRPTCAPAPPLRPLWPLW